MSIPVLYYSKIKNSSIVIYPSFELFPRSNKVSKNSLNNLQSNKTKGDISMKSATKAKDISVIWILSILAYMRHKRIAKKQLYKYLTFVTLTLPSVQVHCDKTIKRECLNHFIIYLQRNFKVQNLVWKQEKQQNGNVHFHLLIDRPVHWSEIRRLWNDAIAKLGYIEAYKTKFDKMTLADYLAYRKATAADKIASATKSYYTSVAEEWTNPNSTDIHALEKVDNIAGYIAKYIAKNENRHFNCGRLWGCSNSLKSLSYYSILLDGDIEKLAILLKESDGIKVQSNEYFTIFSGRYNAIIKKHFPDLSKDIQHHYLQQFLTINQTL